MSDRGMKKWNAYRSLPEHDPAIRKVQQEQYKVARPIISNEEAEIINEILINYQGEELVINYYRNEQIHEVISIVKIDAYNRVLVLPDKSKIKLNEIIGLKINK